MKLFLLTAAFIAATSTAAASGRPAWVEGVLAPVRPAAVVAGLPAGQGSGMVILAGGVEAGLRPGQVLEVRTTATAAPAAELLVAAVGPTRSVARVSRLDSESVLLPGALAAARIR